MTEKVICKYCDNDTFYAEIESKVVFLGIKVGVPLLTCTRCVKQVDNS